MYFIQSNMPFLWAKNEGYAQITYGGGLLEPRLLRN